MRMFAEALAIEALATEASATEASATETLATETLATEADACSRLLTSLASNAGRLRAAPDFGARRGPPITALDKDAR